MSVKQNNWRIRRIAYYEIYFCSTHDRLNNKTGKYRKDLKGIF